MSTWYLYLLDCDGRVYTGISTDPSRRLREHASGNSRGAKFTRAAGTLTVKYQVAIGDRSLASKVEARIKRLPRERKLELIERNPLRQELLEHLELQ